MNPTEHMQNILQAGPFPPFFNISKIYLIFTGAGLIQESLIEELHVSIYKI